MAAILEADPAFAGRLSAAAAQSRLHLGKRVTFYLPGMIRSGRERGCYPALSVTGDRCDLLCDHCRGELLKPMIAASTPEDLHARAVALAERGAQGILLTGGSDREGRIDWKPFLDTIRRIREKTGLVLSVHSGMLDEATALALKRSGVSQALMDVVGDDDTYERVFHLQNGTERVRRTLDAVRTAEMEPVPHIVAGVDFGRVRGEFRAVELLREYAPGCVVFVVLFPFRNTPMAAITPPSAVDVANVMLYCREVMPDVPQSLGCERPRSRDGYVLEELVLRSGVNRMAVPSDRAETAALDMGLEISRQKTCCSHRLWGENVGGTETR